MVTQGEAAASYGGIATKSIWYLTLTFVITSIVFVSLLLLYSSGMIKVGHKFKAVVFTLFMGSIFESRIIFISSFFTPMLKDVLWGNGVIGYVVAIVSMLLAVLNLVVEFDNVAKTVNHRLRKKYEWVAAYGLMITIILLFMRILELPAKITGQKEN